MILAKSAKIAQDHILNEFHLFVYNVAFLYSTHSGRLSNVYSGCKNVTLGTSILE